MFLLIDEQIANSEAGDPIPNRPIPVLRVTQRDSVIACLLDAPPFELRLNLT